MDISSQIESILFWKAEPITIEKLSSLLNVDTNTIKTSLIELEKKLIGRGITLIQNDNEVSLVTSKENAGLIEQITKEELNKDLGKAGLETLSIILYEGPISRSEIDYIRGVNSQFILRALLIRGLVERIESQEHARVFLYKPTLELMSHLGISKIGELPDYEKIRMEIESFKKNEESNHDQS